MYRARTKFRIDCLDAEKYLEAFLVLPGVGIDQAVGDLVLSFGKPEERSEVDYVDILPLMKILDAATSFKASFYLHDADCYEVDLPHVRSFLLSLLHPYRLPLLNQHLQNDIVAIEVYYYRLEPVRFVFIIRPDYPSSSQDLEACASKLGFCDEVVPYIDFYFI